MKLFVFCLMVLSAEGQIYISPGGDDHAVGTKERPLRTVSTARDAIRRSKPQKPLTVWIRGGTYSLTEPLVFTAADSGTAEAPITYAAYPNEHPIVSGGRRIQGWKRGQDGNWTAKVEGSFHDLWVNGVRRQRARSPNTGFYNVDGPISFEAHSKFRFHDQEIRAQWAGGDVEVNSLLKWQSLRMPIAAVDEATHMVTLAGKRPQSGSIANARYWIENTLDALDAPGEWYLDSRTNTLYYRPMPGEDLARAVVEAPRLEQLVRFEAAHHITVRGIEFRYADWSLGPQGYAELQAAAAVPAAISGETVRFIAIENCIFTRLGQYAVAFGKGSKDNRIAGNQMFELGAGGVKIGDADSEGHPNGEHPGYPHNDEETSSRNLIADNHVHHIGNTFPGAVGIWIGQSDGNIIAHNEIDNTYFTGISVGWTWGWGPTAAKNNIIEFNNIHDIGRGLLSDMGCIYTLGRQPGTVVRNNVCHDVTRTDHQPGGYGAWGIYLDSASSGIMVENNVVYRAYEGGFHNQYGEQNEVRNNVFALGSRAQLWRTRLAPEISFTFEHNLVYWTSGMLLAGAAPGAGRWDEGKVKFDFNLYYHPSAEPVRYGNMSFAEWQQRNQDEHSLIADPKFGDPEHGDFTVPPDSAALKIGFKPIDLSEVGPRATDIKHPVTGLAGIRLCVADLAKARAFYAGVMGFEETGAGAFHVNRNQTITLTPASSPGEPLLSVVFAAATERAPMTDPDGHRIEFIKAARNGPARPGPISHHILHVGFSVRDLRTAAEFYGRNFGLIDVWRGPTPAEFRINMMRVPGDDGDYMEVMTPPGPIPAGASMTHICFDVADIRQAYKALKEKGVTLRGEPRVASNGHMVLNMADPNGIRIEFMEPAMAAVKP